MIDTQHRPASRAGLPFRATLSVAALLSVAACASQPPPPESLLPPAHEASVTLSPGGLLGRFAGDEASSAEDVADSVDGPRHGPIAVRVQVLYLRSAHPASLGLVSGQAALVADLTGATPVLGTADLTAAARATVGDAARAWLTAIEPSPEASVGAVDSLVLIDETHVVPRASTLRVSIEALEAISDPRDWLDEFPDRGPIPRRVGVAIEACADGPLVAIEVTDLDPDHEDELREDVRENPDVLPGPPPPAQDEILRTESLRLDELRPTAQSPLLVEVPAPFASGNGAALAFFVEIVERDIHAVELEEATRMIANARDADALQREPMTEAAREQVRREEALRQFERLGGRASLLLLADESGAALAGDLALVADDAFLTSLAGLAELPIGAGGAVGAAADPEQDLSAIGWRLEAAAWQALGRAALEERLDPELVGVLHRRAGALADFPDIVLDALASSGESLETFREKLVVENLYFLEDASPSARVRAHDWLVERGRAIADYDPLVERDVRRAALERAQDDPGGQP